MYSQPTPVLWLYAEQCQSLTNLPIVASDQTGVHTTPAAPHRCLINHTNRACGASACSARVPPARAHEDLLPKDKSRGMWAYGTGLSFESGTRRALSRSFESSKGLKALHDFIEFSILARITFRMYVWITHSPVSVFLAAVITKLGYGIRAGLAFPPSI
jgi:hypothetical protein